MGLIYLSICCDVLVVQKLYTLASEVSLLYHVKLV